MLYCCTFMSLFLSHCFFLSLEALKSACIHVMCKSLWKWACFNFLHALANDLEYRQPFASTRLLLLLFISGNETKDSSKVPKAL